MPARGWVGHRGPREPGSWPGQVRYASRRWRAFFGQLALDAGFPLAWQYLDPVRNVEASAAIMRGGPEPMRKMLDALVRDGSLTGQAAAAAQAVRESMRQVSLAAAALVLPEPEAG
jgi:hypothetical protein